MGKNTPNDYDDGSNSHKGKLITSILSFQNYHDMQRKNKDFKSQNVKRLLFLEQLPITWTYPIIQRKTWKFNTTKLTKLNGTTTFNFPH